jgi:hypothetical protein
VADDLLTPRPHTTTRSVLVASAVDGGSTADWLPQEQLAWFVWDALEEMDLSAFDVGD